MAVQSAAKLEDLPKNAIRLTEVEAVDFQWTIIRNWPNILEVWPFKIGIAALGSAGCLSGLVINSHFRKKLKLRSFGLLSTNVAIGLAPAIVISTSHSLFITGDILIGKQQCSLCLQQKAALFQCFFGVVYPMVLSPIGNSMYATRHGTYRLPHYNEYGETVKLWWSFVKAGKGKFLTLIVAQSLFAGFITWHEQLKMIWLRERFTVFNEELDEEMARKKKDRERVKKINEIEEKS